MISGTMSKHASKSHADVLTADAMENIISLIFSFVGLSVSCDAMGIESFPLLCRALGCHENVSSKFEKCQGLPPVNQSVARNSRSSLGFNIGDLVHVWSNSFRKWFEDGTITQIRSDGALFVQYNRQKPSAKWVPTLAAQRLLRVPSFPVQTNPHARGNVLSEHVLAEKMVDEQRLCDDTGSGLFSDCVVLVSSLGGVCMSARRKQLLQARVQDCGGAVAETWSPAVTHLVVAPEVSEITLQSEYGQASRGLDFVAVVNDLWLCNSLIRGRRLPERDYLWHSTRKPADELPTTPPRMSNRSASDTSTPETKRRRYGELHESKAKVYPLREGDWTCPKCGQHNFRKRDICWREGCGCLRAENDIENTKDHIKHQIGEGDSQLSQAQNATDASRTPEALRGLIEEEFRTCADGWGARGDKWRSWQYKKAELLMKQAQSLSRYDLEQLGLTPKFVDKCKEIQRNGFLEQAIRFREDPDLRVLLELTRMHGVGEKLAHRWLRMGVRSLDDVRCRVDLLPSSVSGPATGLSKGQRLALQFVDDFREKIGRIEVEKFAESVRQQLNSLSISGHVVPCGSYRAGEEWSSSVILVISVENNADIGELSEQILSSLRQSGLLVADLSCGTLAEPWARTVCRPAGAEPPHARVFLGVGQGLPASGDKVRFRRLDLVFCAHEALPFATIQWTGNDGGIFNRELKRIAAFRGFHLSTTFLCKADREGVRGRNVGNVCRAGFRINCATEEDVFTALGLPYQPPDKRRMDSDMLALVERASLTISAYRTEVKAAFDRANNLLQA
mmetsp:Transcript_54940/g.86997  ORF Transcript_54940/g.86997 Transcript_54940/m.86997 type:complete len:790 (+) Transcript_54940:1-2370(+)